MPPLSVPLFGFFFGGGTFLWWEQIERTKKTHTHTHTHTHANTQDMGGHLKFLQSWALHKKYYASKDNEADGEPGQ